MNKAIRIVIVGRQGTGKTVLAEKIREAASERGVLFWIINRNEPVPNLDGEIQNRNVIETYLEEPNPVEATVAFGRHTSLYINLDRGYTQELHGYLPDELKSLIISLATAQHNWVKERNPLTHGGSASKAELDVAKDALINSIKKDIAYLKRRLWTIRAFRVTRISLITLAFVSFIAAIILVGQSGVGFLRALIISIGAAALSNFFKSE